MRLSLLRILLLILFVSITSIGCSSDEDPVSAIDGKDDLPQYEGYELVWNDEFEGDEIDRTKWGFEVNAGGGGNNELQYYLDREENSFVEDGKLHIVARQEEYTGPGGTRYYTSARMRTAEKGDWKYARIDVRATIPYGQGLWPAIWMLPTDWEYGGWPASGEIDIMEHVNNQTKIHGSVHTEAYNHKIGTQKSGEINVVNGDDQFHVYSIIWTEDKIDFLMDDEIYYSFANDNQGNYATWPFDKRFHILLNVAVGGDWPGPPSTSTLFPKEMVIDYVRVYQQEN